MKVYVTKWALTKGILEVNGAEIVSGKYASRGALFTSEFERTQEAAAARVEEMRIKKIASLKKQIAKLEKLDVSTVKSW